MCQLENNAVVSFGILLVDFIESKENLSMENTFKEFCESKESKKFGGMQIDGSRALPITNHGRITKIPIPPEFELVELISFQESYFVVDIYCYGILKKEIIEKIESDPQEVRKLIDRAQNNLKEFIKPRLKGILSRDELGEGYSLLPVRILHLNPEITTPFRVKTVDNKEIYDEKFFNLWMMKNLTSLNTLGFNTVALMSKENLNLISKIVAWGDYRSGFVLVSFLGLTNEEYCPIYHILPSDMLRMLRVYYWSRFRSKQINSERETIETFYQKLQDTKKDGPISHYSKRLDEVNDIYDDVLGWQLKLLSSLTHIKDEIEHFKIHLYNLDVAYGFEKLLDTVKTDSRENIILFEGEEKFDWRLFPSIYERTKITVNSLNNSFNVLGERQKTLVTYIHDLVSTLTAIGNIDLQKNIRRLTKASLIVAIVALIIAVIAILLNVI